MTKVKISEQETNIGKVQLLHKIAISKKDCA